MSEEKRESPRFVTELTVKLRRSEWEEPFDEAKGHDVSMAGFKVESQAVLLDNQRVHFELELHDGGRATGFGRVAWVKQQGGTFWAGIAIDKMPSVDRRRLRKALHPESVDWVRIGDTAFTTAFVIVTAAALHRLIFNRQDLHPWLFENGPMLLAGAVAAWALVATLRRF